VPFSSSCGLSKNISAKVEQIFTCAKVVRNIGTMPEKFGVSFGAGWSCYLRMCLIVRRDRTGCVNPDGGVVAVVDVDGDTVTSLC